MKSNVVPITPTLVMPTIRPARHKKPPNLARKYLTHDEVDALMKAAKANRQAHRDRTLIMLTYRHGLRVSEACSMEWQQVNFDRAELWVQRLKGSDSGNHPLAGDELRMLRQMQREQSPASPFMFTTTTGAQITPDAFAAILNRLKDKAGLKIDIHPHMLRHGCGYYLTNKGEDLRRIQTWLGHKNISNTVTYTALATDALRDMWR